MGINNTGIGLALAFHQACILIVIMPVALGVTLKINPKVHAEWGSNRGFLVTQSYRGFSRMTTPTH
jgi:hypothetical protein